MKKVLLAAFVFFAATYPVNASRSVVRASTQYLKIETGIVTVPFTVSLWVNPTSLVDGMVCFSALNSGQGFYVIVRQSGANYHMGAQSAGASSGQAESTNNLSTGSWQHIGAVFAATNSRSIYLNGTKTTDTTTSSPNTPNKTGLGTYYNGTPGNIWDGLIAEMGVWNVALTDDEMASLRAGISPLKVRPGSLIDYWPLYGNTTDENGVKGNVFLNVSTTHSADHPRIYR